MYTYKCSVVSVHDGDTLTLSIDLGFGITYVTPVRLLGLDAPELGTPEGKASRAFVANWVAEHATKLYVKTQKDKKDKYGRILATLFVLDGATLNSESLNSKMSEPWTGEGPKPFKLRETSEEACKQ